MVESARGVEWVHGADGAAVCEGDVPAAATGVEHESAGGAEEVQQLAVHGDIEDPHFVQEMTRILLFNSLPIMI